MSSGQSDVIDLAVSLVVMAQMGLENYPLFLDEVGASFDEKHQDNLMLFIKKLVMTNKCSSVFMISHYASQHGGFNSVDVNVINGDNIRLFHKEVNKCLHLS
jgi:ABC-type hemin transport system ATPase subunit